jgi:hypothetical protein
MVKPRRRALEDAVHVVKLVLALRRIVREQAAEIKPFRI